MERTSTEPGNYFSGDLIVQGSMGQIGEELQQSRGNDFPDNCTSPT
jgi:hypothetical protein